MIILINFVQLPSTSESPNDEESPTGHENEEPCRDKSNYSKKSNDYDEQIISVAKQVIAVNFHNNQTTIGSISDSGSDTSLDLRPPPTKRPKQGA